MRLGTFNVHEFTNTNGQDTFNEICQILCSVDLDLIGLQECNGKMIPELLLQLNNCCKGKQKFLLAAKFGGTTVFTRLSVVGEAIKPGEGRYSCCSALWPDSDQPFQVMVIHLDHRKETTRMKELQTIVQDFQKQNLQLPDIIMGDFNALTRSDYSSQEWDEIMKVRILGNWELPMTDVTAAMTCIIRKGKAATKIFPSTKAGYADAYQSAPRREGPKSTCRFGTRIDYVYYNRQALSAHQWIIEACEQYRCGGISDHNLVVATFGRYPKKLQK